jgi:hypothetical protein
MKADDLRACKARVSQQAPPSTPIKGASLWSLQDRHDMGICPDDGCTFCKAEWEEYNTEWRKRRDVDGGQDK